LERSRRQIVSDKVETQLIFAKMAAILKELEPVTKGRRNDHFNYSYRGIDDALAALNPLLAKHEVFLLPQYSETQVTEYAKGFRATILLNLKFVATDGSFVECSVPGEGVDKSDKGTMKAIANAMKYAIYNTFCIPTEEKKDSEAFADVDADSGKAPPKRKRKAPAYREPAKKKAEEAGGDDDVSLMIETLASVKNPETLEKLRASARNLVLSLDKTDPKREALRDAFKAKETELCG
jgi:hypothetical protein